MILLKDQPFPSDITKKESLTSTQLAFGLPTHPHGASLLTPGKFLTLHEVCAYKVDKLPAVDLNGTQKNILRCSFSSMDKMDLFPEISL